MKLSKKILFLLSLGVLSLSACNGSGSESSSHSGGLSTSSYNPEDDGPYTGVGPYVKKVANMPDDFVIGMDSSSVLSLEESGVKYYDFDGQEKDLFTILAGQGINTVRVRIWVDPWTAPDEEGVKHGYGGGNLDIDRAVQIGKRVTAAGMKLMANFHYSDFWADPSRQLAPKAWEGQTLEQKKVSLYNYTKESMQKFKDNNVDVGYVQIGNETNKGIAGETNDSKFENFSALVSQGSKAVKEVYPNAQTIVHFTNPETGTYQRIASALDDAGCDYDIFGTSYYPFFHGTLDNLVKQLNNVKNYAPGKKIMVVETSYANTDLDTDFCGNQFDSTSSYDKHYPVTQGGQIANFRNICDALVNRVKDGNTHVGIGVCYWEGTWISVNKSSWEENRVLWNQYGSGWASDWAAEYDPEVKKYGGGGTVVDNQCFFDKNGKPLESLKMFNLLKTGNRTEEYVEGAEDATVEYMSNEEIKLPATVRAIYNSDNRRETDVTWDLSEAKTSDNKKVTLNGDLNKLKEEGPGTYKVSGTIKDGDKSFTVNCSVKLTAANYVADPSFEENVNPVVVPGKSGDYTGSDAWTITDGAADNDGYLWITRGNDNHPQTGKFDVHGYSVAGKFNYNLTQENITVSKEVNVKMRFFVTGGAKAEPCPAADQHSYAAIYDGETEIKRVEFTITKWGEIHTVDAEDITLSPGKSYKLVFHIEINSPGVWLDLDDVSIYE